MSSFFRGKFTVVWLLLFVLMAPIKAWSEVLTKGYDHLGLTVSDLEATTSFFVDALDWKLLGKDQAYPATFVSDGHMMISLWSVKDSKKAVSFDRKMNVGLHHLAIGVVSFEALESLYNKIKDVPGVVIEFAPEKAFGGPGKHMMIREPSGNRIEFIHRP